MAFNLCANWSAPSNPYRFPLLQERQPADEPRPSSTHRPSKTHNPACFRLGACSPIETTFLPSNTASRFSSARILRFSFGSWSSCLRMYSQSFLVSSVRGSGSLPTTVASAASGCTGLLRAFLGAAAFFGVGIRQLERVGLGCQAKNQMCFSGSAGSGSSSANLSRWSWDRSSAELSPSGFGGREEEVRSPGFWSQVSRTMQSMTFRLGFFKHRISVFQFDLDRHIQCSAILYSTNLKKAWIT